jgi:hypothetical protein
MIYPLVNFGNHPFREIGLYRNTGYRRWATSHFRGRFAALTGYAYLTS